VKPVPNYDILEAEFTVCNATESLLQNTYQETIIKTEELYCFAFIL